MTETTLERMARAFYGRCPTEFHIVGASVCRKTWEELTLNEQFHIRDAIKVALQEARTPDHEITAAVVKPGADRTQAVLDFRAMIDAILGEKP
jgi:aromatic ring hydroxylase